MPEKLFLTFVEKLFESNLGPVFTTFSDVLQNITQKLEQISILKKMRHFFEKRNWNPDLGVFNDEKGPFGRLRRVTAA
jgi:hypothetical protein